MPADVADRTGIGDRIRELRTGREPRLTQRELAERAGVSVDLVSKLEQGSKQTALLTTLNKISRALDVDVSALLTSPMRIDEAGGDRDAGVLAIRRAVTSVRQEGEPAPVAELAIAATAVWDDYWTNRFDVLGASLPELIRTARATVHEQGSTSAWAVLADTYGAAASMLVHLGHLDLAHQTMERAQAAADQSEDELRCAALAGWMSWLLVHQAGRDDDARYLAMRTADEIEPDLIRSPAEQISVWGSLLVSAAVATARQDRPDEADEMLSLAETAAVRVEGMGWSHRRVYERTFGPALIVMQLVDAAVATGRPGRALKLSRRMPSDSGLPLASRARHRADIAYAYTQIGKPKEAEAVLFEIERDAQRWMRYQPYPRAILRELWENERHTSTLRGLATRMNVPLD